MADGVFIFGVLHLLMVCMAAGLFLLFVRSERSDPDSDEDDGGGNGGGGGNQPLNWSPKPGPSGALPMQDAVQAKLRLRGCGPPLESDQQRDRRPAHRPEPSPARRRERVGRGRIQHFA